VHITTLDNPGWQVEIDIADTPCATQVFPDLRKNYEHDLEWLSCRKVGSKLEGQGGPGQLEPILVYFLNWLEEHS
jgi:hypothetical protein